MLEFKVALQSKASLFQQKQRPLKGVEMFNKKN